MDPQGSQNHILRTTALNVTTIPTKLSQARNGKLKISTSESACDIYAGKGVEERKHDRESSFHCLLQSCAPLLQLNNFLPCINKYIICLDFCPLGCFFPPPHLDEINTYKQISGKDKDRIWVHKARISFICTGYLYIK